MDDATTLISVELHRESDDKVFRASITPASDTGGYALTTWTGKTGSKGRTSSKAQRSRADADKAFDKAVTKKLKEGYFPTEGSDFPVLDIDLSAREPGDTLELLAARPRMRETIYDDVRHCPPLATHDAGMGREYMAGPDGHGLWSAVSLFVERRGQFRQVEPDVRGSLRSARDFYFGGFAVRPDARAMLVGLDDTLYEIDLEAATAEVVHTFPQEKKGLSALGTGGLPLAKVSNLIYAADGTILWAENSTLVALERTDDATPKPVFELPSGGAFKSIARLCNGAIALAQVDALTVIEGDPAGGYRQTHRLALRYGARLATWLGGRVLLVGTDTTFSRKTWLLAVDDAGLHPMPTLEQAMTDAFELDGHCWFRAYRGGGSGPSRVALNVEAAWRKACQAPTLGADDVIELAPLHDTISAALDPHKPTTVDDVRAALDARPASLEMRATHGDRTPPLGFAAWRGAAEMVDLLIDAGADLDAIALNGRPPTSIALERGEPRIAARLIDAGASPTLPPVVDVDGTAVPTESPLVAAARGGYQAHVEQMLERHPDTDLDTPGFDGSTALIAAMGGGHTELATLLVDRGAALTAPQGAPSMVSAAVASGSAELVRRVVPDHPELDTEEARKALRGALLNLSVKAVEPAFIDTLIDAGLVDTSPEALYRAVEAGHVAAVRAFLAAGADPQAIYATATRPSPALSTALFTKTPDVEVIDALLDGGADIDATDNRGFRPLILALSNAPLAVVEHLIERGASLERGSVYWSPAASAANANRDDRLALLELLEARGVDLDEPTNAGISPLTQAIWRGFGETAQWLLDRGVDIEAGEFTPLMAASIQGNLERVELLLERGADPTRKAINPFDKHDNEPRTAQGHAERANKTEVVARLAELGGGQLSLHQLIEVDDLEAVAAALDAGADIEAKSARAGLRPLHVAAGVSLDAVELLLERGANPNATNQYGATPLMTAAQGDGAAALARVEALLAAGADATLRHANGGSALEIAVSGGNLAVVRRLLDAGCPVEDKRKRKLQPLHLAARANQPAMINLLLDHGARIDAIATTIHGGTHTPLHEAAEANAVAAARALLWRGADLRAGSELKSNPDEHDDAYWAEGGYSPIHRAAEKGHLDVLTTLLRHDRSGVGFRPTARGRYANELAENHPRCRELLEAVLDSETSVDEFLARKEAEQSQAAALDAEGNLFLERVDDEVDVAQVPAAVRQATTYRDRLAVHRSGLVLVQRFVRGMMEIAIGDADGLHEPSTSIRAHELITWVGPDATRALVSDGESVFAVDLTTRSVRELLPVGVVDGPITQLAGLAAGAFLVVTKDALARFPARTDDSAAPSASWTLPATSLYRLMPTGTDVVLVSVRDDVLRPVWACAGEDGLRPYARQRGYQRELDVFRDDEGRLHGVLQDHESAGVHVVLHHVDEATCSAAPLEALPDRDDIDALPPMVVRN